MAGLTNVPSDPLNDAATCYSYVALCALSLHQAYPGQQNVPVFRDFVHQLVEHLCLSENVRKIAISPFTLAADAFDCCNRIDCIPQIEPTMIQLMEDGQHSREPYVDLLMESPCLVNCASLLVSKSLELAVKDGRI